MKEILNAAVQAAQDLGASYADARWSHKRTHVIAARDLMINAITDEFEAGIAVRVFLDHCWGFAAADVNTVDEAVKLARKACDIARSSRLVIGEPIDLVPVSPFNATWTAPIQIDPFQVPLQEKTDLLLAINGELKKQPEIVDCSSMMFFMKFYKLFVSSAGSCIEQTIFRSEADYNAVAVNEDRFTSRSFQGMPRGAGYELIHSLPLLQEAPRVAREAAENLRARSPGEEKTDLILMPNHTRLVIHETIGHATELDRVLGWEADYAGTSFATPEKLNQYQYGSQLLNVTADRTIPQGLATCLYDDDGVPTQKWPIIQNGILVDYSTTRDTAPIVGNAFSRGCSYADNWSTCPILRMANVSIDPGPADAPDLNQLIADTDYGILVDGMESFSIDHQRINFQFGGDFCRRIRKGKLEEPLWNVVYEGSNPQFWNALDAICNPSEWKPFGIFGCAKGQPVQTTALTHGSAPLRLRGVTLKPASKRGE